MSYVKKSPWVIHYDGSSCNGCDIEVLAALCPGFDAERFGVINTGNPKHADIFLVTGSVNKQNAPVIRQIYEQMVEPKVVAACGICACSGGVFRDCYNVSGGIDTIIPVDVYVPGCAVRPESIIDAVVQAIEVLEQKSIALKNGTYKSPTMPVNKFEHQETNNENINNVKLPDKSQDTNNSEKKPNTIAINDEKIINEKKEELSSKHNPNLLNDNISNVKAPEKLEINNKENIISSNNENKEPVEDKEA